MPPPIALTIAGFDPSNGAGVTADLQVFAAHGLFGVSAITALTIQSTLGVASVEPVSAQLLTQTLDHLTSDLPPQGIKIGMLATREIVSAVDDFLQAFAYKNAAKPQIPVVLDSVLVSSSGALLLDKEGVGQLQEKLLGHVSWVTPNWAELAILTGLEVSSLAGAEAALHALGDRYPSLHAVATGGDQGGHPIDLLRTPKGEIHRFAGERVDTTSTHGTGCAFSSALLSRLVLCETPLAALAGAKKYVEGALRYAPGIGHGRGPIDLLWPLRHPPATGVETPVTP
ncbi:bifunctional hydroxymethylpyrimidine kinase/phosphomethylpyrimidine kinase [Granulicella mallensis]|uniref:hydroxymethylpyrimidine kinase n=1 Tax=Granulicella mallensis (strain ATCC BAA-1857 / DSM 23137 / MP5ACTX8) TaxID=682795 RepID=G8NY86_GRAMM|nr:bifunctional hydroxymethylpyrimidine kinase/phosphomethylpyrimidine kinase [Granulicella mallensis]AEU36760.1 phosphomethylpyrimidine kinase [Granulicella mallensis MP5ACTX8]